MPILLKSIQNENIQINLHYTYHKKIAKVNYTIIIMISDFKAPLNYSIFFIDKIFYKYNYLNFALRLNKNFLSNFYVESVH